MRVDRDNAKTHGNYARTEAHFVQPEANERQGNRCCVELDVSVGSEHNFYSGLSENLSAGGVFVATHKKRQAGEHLELTINLPNSEQPIKGTGQVVWVRIFREGSSVPPGLGVKFVKLAEGSQERVDEFLKSREPLFYED